MFSAVYHSAPPTRLKRLCAAAALVVLLLGMTTQPANAEARSDTRDEASVRAALIFNLLKFAQWPETLPADATLHLCAIDASPAFVSALRPLEQRSVGQHALQTKSVSSKELDNCEIIVSDAAQTPYSITQISDRNVLTIGEAGFIDRGGMIGITVVDGRLRFEINLEAMKRSGISLPSQVLQLAVRTR
ncbi:MAG: YfiR family protein [Spongiibacteraceae bacterium]